MALLLLVGPVRAQTSSMVWQHRGFTVVVEDIDSKDQAAVRAGWERQIDIVCAVGLEEPTLDFLRGVPQRLVAADRALRGSPGLYRPKEGIVRLTSRIASIQGKPVLLHELLHAFHHQRLPAGYANPTIHALFSTASKNGLFATRAHMMQNGPEFFACAATTYLYGVTAQEPFERANLKQQQPELFSHLVSLFGASAGSFEGNLSSGPADKSN